MNTILASRFLKTNIKIPIESMFSHHYIILELNSSIDVIDTNRPRGKLTFDTWTSYNKYWSSIGNIDMLVEHLETPEEKVILDIKNKYKSVKSVYIKVKK